MMTKKDFKQFADAIANVPDDENNSRESLIVWVCPILKANNFRFEEDRFREWIDRRVKGESTKGLG